MPKSNEQTKSGSFYKLKNGVELPFCNVTLPKSENLLRQFQKQSKEY